MVKNDLQRFPLVSIVVPSFQQARFLRTAIDSILAQDYSPIEVLVLDGGSSDGSREILESYGDRIWFRSTPDNGQSSAINEGFGRSRGEIVAWLNSDDFYYPGAVGKAVEALRSNPEAGLVYGEGNQVDEEGNVKWRFPETVPFDLWRLANVADYILQPTAFFRRDALFAAGLLNEGLNWGLDWDLWIRMGKRCPFVHLDEVLAASRLHGETKTATGGLRRMRELYGVLSRHDVTGISPALVIHVIATAVRAVLPSAEIISTDVVTGSMPGIFSRLSRSVVAGFERMVRKWLQNVQGVWPDGMAGNTGQMWLPSAGSRCLLEMSGRNLAISGQKVVLRACGREARTGNLGPGEPFRLSLEIPEGSVPVKVMLTCSRTCKVGPLDPKLGPRRAGFILEDYRVVPLSEQPERRPLTEHTENAEKSRNRYE